MNMEEEKDFLYYDWQNRENWDDEIAYLEKDKSIKGLSTFGFSQNKEFLKLGNFNSEEFFCACDVVRSYFQRPSGYYHKFNEEFSSHFLKEMAGDALRKITNGRIDYVSEGTLILAMHHIGYAHQRIGKSSSCIFNIPKCAVKRLANLVPEYKV